MRATSRGRGRAARSDAKRREHGVARPSAGSDSETARDREAQPSYIFWPVGLTVHVSMALPVASSSSLTVMLPLASCSTMSSP